MARMTSHNDAENTDQRARPAADSVGGTKYWSIGELWPLAVFEETPWWQRNIVYLQVWAIQQAL